MTDLGLSFGTWNSIQLSIHLLKHGPSIKKLDVDPERELYKLARILSLGEDNELGEMNNGRRFVKDYGHFLETLKIIF